MITVTRFLLFLFIFYLCGIPCVSFMIGDSNLTMDSDIDVISYIDENQDSKTYISYINGIRIHQDSWWGYLYALRLRVVSDRYCIWIIGFLMKDYTRVAFCDRSFPIEICFLGEVLVWYIHPGVCSLCIDHLKSDYVFFCVMTYP